MEGRSQIGNALGSVRKEEREERKKRGWEEQTAKGRKRETPSPGKERRRAMSSAHSITFLGTPPPHTHTHS